MPGHRAQARGAANRLGAARQNGHGCLVAKLKREEAVVGGIGNTNFDLWSAGQRPQNFYMLGSMGWRSRSRSVSQSRSRSAT